MNKIKIWSIPLSRFGFYPDKPKRTTKSCLQKYEKYDYCAVSKLDGYNAFVCNNGKSIEIYSRTWSKLPVSDEVLHEWSKLSIPDNSIINCEWMKNRAGSKEFKYDGPECLYLLTPYVIGGESVINVPYRERREWAEKLGITSDDIKIRNSVDIKGRILLPAKTESNFDDFYNLHITIPRTEGLVIYSNNGKLIASKINSCKSDSMLKCKYREGDDGRTMVK